MQADCYEVKNLRISSVAIKLAKNIGKHVSPVGHFISAASKMQEDILEMDQSIKSESDHSLFGDDEEESNEDSDTTTPNLTQLMNCEECLLPHHLRC